MECEIDMYYLFYLYFLSNGPIKYLPKKSMFGCWLSSVHISVVFLSNLGKLFRKILAIPTNFGEENV